MCERMSHFDSNSNVRHFGFRPMKSDKEITMRGLLRTADWSALEVFLRTETVNTEDIERCLMFIVVSLKRNPAQDEHLVRCADMFLHALKTPLCMVDLLTYTRHPEHLSLIQKFIPYCSIGAVNAAVVHASKHQHSDLFELLYPHSNAAQVAQLCDQLELSDAERFLFDDRQQREHSKQVLTEVVGQNGRTQEARKL